MLYHLLYPLASSFHFLNVFKYLTFRTIYAVITALVVSFVLGPWVIRKLQAIQVTQVIRTDGPESHLKKQGTPTMGGVLIIAATVIPTLLWADLSNRFVWIALSVIVGYGLIGFLDDYKKVVEKNPKGLSPRQKTFWQVLIGLMVGTVLFYTPGFSTELTIPFFKNVRPDLGIFYIPFVMLVMTCENAWEAFRIGVQYQQLTYLYGTLRLEPGAHTSTLVLAPMPLPRMAIPRLHQPYPATTSVRPANRTLVARIMPSIVLWPVP